MTAAEGVLFQVEDLADDVVLEQEHLAGHGAFEAVDAGDAVADLHDPPDLDHVELGLVLADLLFENPRDFTDIDLHISITA